MIIGRTAPTHSSFVAVTSQRPEATGSDSFADILTDTQSQDTQPVSRNTQAVNFGGRVNVFMAGVSRNTHAPTPTGYETIEDSRKDYPRTEE